MDILQLLGRKEISCTTVELDVVVDLEFLEEPDDAIGARLLQPFWWLAWIAKMVLGDNDVPVEGDLSVFASHDCDSINNNNLIRNDVRLGNTEKRGGPLDLFTVYFFIWLVTTLADPFQI